MANDGSAFGSALPDWKLRVSLADAGFLALLLLVFVGLMPFQTRDTSALLHGADTAEAGSGNLARQICYLAAFALIGFAALRTRGLRLVRAVPVTMLLLLAWCAASAAWTAQPDVTLRRAILECVIVVSVFLSVDTLGPERCLELFTWVIVGVLIANWISIPLIAQAVHLPGEADPALVGDWRGLYFHKNIAGSVSAISAIVFFFSMLKTRRIGEAALFVAAVAFTVMTQSKSSMILLPMALVLGAGYHLAWRQPLDRQIALVAAGLVAFVIAAAAISEWTALNRLLSDPNEFTGRAAIWQAELAYIGDHPLLGSGFGSFANTGATSPLSHYVSSAWIANVSHGHSGYLQLLVTIGSVGFALAMVALIVLPAIRLLKGSARALSLKALLFAIFVFVAFHNVVEFDFLESDGPDWVAFLLVLAMLRALPKETP